MFNPRKPLNNLFSLATVVVVAASTIGLAALSGLGGVVGSASAQFGNVPTPDSAEFVAATLTPNPTSTALPTATALPATPSPTTLPTETPFPPATEWWSNIQQAATQTPYPDQPTLTPVNTSTPWPTQEPYTPQPSPTAPFVVVTVTPP